MQGEAWVELIKRIPDTYHDNLVAVTSTGAEIMVQRIMRLEKDFAILRGRPSGSTDAGRVMLLPWDQLNYVAFHKVMLEPEVQRIFGNGEPTAALSISPAEPQPEKGVAESLPESASAPPLPPAPEKEPPKPPAPPPSAKPAPVSKSILLARLRARMASDLPKG